MNTRLIQVPSLRPRSSRLIHPANDPLNQGPFAPNHSNSTQDTPSASSALINFLPYQRQAFQNRKNGIEIWNWARQTGKSFTLAAWAVDRLITIPGWRVTIISNSERNGKELNDKCAQVCRLMRRAFEQVDLSIDDRFENLRAETRITIHGLTGRILVVAPKIETLRGFSGDLILDEFAFQEQSTAIWTEAKPTLDRNPNYLCRIASTPNGKHNEFYRMVTDPLFIVRKVTRTAAHAEGCPIYHPQTRQPITPAEARALDQNKRAYDQNYECAFEDESMALLTYELIAAAEHPDAGVICEQNWSEPALKNILLGGKVIEAGTEGLGAKQKKTAQRWLAEASDETKMFRHILMNMCLGSIDRTHDLLDSNHLVALDDVIDAWRWTRMQNAQPSNSGRSLFAGVDVGRNKDQTVVTVIERVGNLYLTLGILRLKEMRLPDQQKHLEAVLKLPDLRSMKIDMTGLGLGLFEYTQAKYPNKVVGVNFASHAPITERLRNEGRSGATVRVTEALATQLLQAFEDRAVRIPIDAALREDLRKPERFVSSGGQVSIAATRTEAGHADHFWSLALAVNAAQSPVAKPLQYYAWTPKYRQRVARL